ncbi:MAG: response regulator [Labilithrix sp.]|nr:response regulator [Labilithrix sp.]MCW5810066.1 response regulator [Labilithrix sp.]
MGTDRDGDSLAFLVVEDVVVVRDALVRALASHGHVEAVGNLATARTALATRRFDSLIVDVGLPDGSGLDLIPLARQKWPAIWVLVLTGLSDHAVVSKAHELGVRYLLKPFETEQLRVHVEETRARRHAGDRRIAVTLDRWTRAHNLTSSEVELLMLGVRGVPREDIPVLRGVKADTIRKQIQVLIQKTGDESFEEVLNSFLREALSEPT